MLLTRLIRRFSDLLGVCAPSQGGLPDGGDPGTFLKKSSPSDYDFTTATIATSDVAGLVSDLGALADAIDLRALDSAVVHATGSYADPAWITSLAKSKVGLGSVEDTALSTWAGSANLTTLGTIATGIWQGTAIADSYIASASTWNAKVGGSGTTGQLAKWSSSSAVGNATAGTDYVAPSGAGSLTVGQAVGGSPAANAILRVKGGNLTADSNATYDDTTGNLTLKLDGTTFLRVDSSRQFIFGNTGYNSLVWYDAVCDAGAASWGVVRANGQVMGGTLAGDLWAGPGAGKRIIFGDAQTVGTPWCVIDATTIQGWALSSTAGRVRAKIGHAWVTSTDASRTGRLTISACDYTGTDREGLRVESDGAQALVGFFGAAAVAKPSGELAAGLVTLGLFGAVTEVLVNGASHYFGCQLVVKGDGSTGIVRIESGDVTGDGIEAFCITGGLAGFQGYNRGSDAMIDMRVGARNVIFATAATGSAIAEAVRIPTLGGIKLTLATADADAVSSSLFRGSDHGNKLCYKDDGGTVHELY